jgi:hypothetical protein
VDFDSLALLQRLTGVNPEEDNPEEIEDAIISRNERELTRLLIAGFQTEILPQVLKEDWRLEDYFSDYADRKGYLIDYYDVSRMTDIAMARKAKSPEGFIEGGYRNLYFTVKANIDKAEKQFNKRKVKKVRPNFPRSYDEFRKGVPSGVDRYLTVYWAHIHDEMW